MHVSQESSLRTQAKQPVTRAKPGNAAPRVPQAARTVLPGLRRPPLVLRAEEHASQESSFRTQARPPVTRVKPGNTAPRVPQAARTALQGLRLQVRDLRAVSPAPPVPWRQTLRQHHELRAFLEERKV